jgi:hypothetical protein
LQIAVFFSVKGGDQHYGKEESKEESSKEESSEKEKEVSSVND